MKHIKMKYGFTLIELLVVVVIIAVLTAVAVPQYKKAVLKSRFSTVMPMAKAVADAQEVFYLGRGYYVQEGEQGALDITPVEAEKTKVTLSKKDKYDYVLAERTDIPQAHYIMYQQHSVNFPGEIHCEALDNDTQTIQMCNSLGFTKDKGHILHNNYTTYTTQEGGNGVAPGMILLLEKSSCENAKKKGFTCENTISEDGETAQKKSCKQELCVISDYDENGKVTSKKLCNMQESSCYAKVLYDNNGNPISQAKCKTWDVSKNTCSAYDYLYEFSYKDGYKLANRCKTASIDTQTETCGQDYAEIQGYQYDNRGNITAYYRCEPNTDGICTRYDVTTYVYDGNDNVESKMYCPYSSSSTTCGSQQYPRSYTYTYGDDGLLEQSSSTWLGGGEINEYFYDDYGNLVAYKGCSSRDCSNPYASEIILDEDGNTIGKYSCSGGTLNTETKKCNTSVSGRSYDLDYVGYPDYLPNI